MSWNERIASGADWEDEVRAYVNSLPGWKCERFGQVNLPESMRAILKKSPTLLRWMPDILAGHDDGRLILLEAKSGRADTLNWDVEINSVLSLKQHADAYEIPGYFVFQDWTVATPSLILRKAINGKPSANGSGTPYLIIPKIWVSTRLQTVLL